MVLNPGCESIDSIDIKNRLANGVLVEELEPKSRVRKFSAKLRGLLMSLLHPAFFFLISLVYA